MEPSKVGFQHVFVIEGFLRAIAASARICRSATLELQASASTLSHLSEGARAPFRCRVIAVMNPERRRLVRKCLLEFFVITRVMLRMRDGDILFVSCALPPTMVLLEFARCLLRRGRVIVVLHGEVEYLLKADRSGPSTLGYWARMWLKARREDSGIELAVLGSFIRGSLASADAAKLSEHAVHVLRPPLEPKVVAPRRSGGLRVGFIGFRTKYKSFDDVVRLASELPDIEFVAIGGGKVQDVRTGAERAISGNLEYLDAVSSCDVTIFPYKSGYSASLSASAVDALVCGTLLIASRLPFFESLVGDVGAECVRIVDTHEALTAELRNLDPGSVRGARIGRQSLVTSSPYGLVAVSRAFDQMAGACPQESV